LSGTFGLANQAIWVGARNGGTNLMLGYISGIQLIDGSAVTTVPTTPPTAVSGTNLLLNFTNAGIYDAAMDNVLQTVGNAQVSTSIVKYGSGSMSFDGTGDWLIAPASPLQNLSSSDFTIEGWVYFTTTSAVQNIAGTWAAVANRGWFIYFDPTLKMTFTYSTTGSNAVDAGFGYTPPTNTWVHIAYVRSNGSLTFYANGVQQGSVNAIGTAVIYANNQPLYVGERGSATGTAFNGYIDDFRISRVARYTANFIPPQVALPRQ
jgi:hypothetical protein